MFCWKSRLGQCLINVFRSNCPTCRRKPWSHLDNEWAIMYQIGVATQHPPLPEPSQLSDAGIEFIELCLTINPAERPTAGELFYHPWLASMVQQMVSRTVSSLALTCRMSTHRRVYPPADLVPQRLLSIRTIRQRTTVHSVMLRSQTRPVSMANSLIFKSRTSSQTRSHSPVWSDMSKASDGFWISLGPFSHSRVLSSSLDTL